MRRFTISPFTGPGTRQTRHGVIEGEEGIIAATRDPLVAAARHGVIEGAEGIIAATRVLVAATRHGVIEGAEGTIAATRDPLVAADRLAAIAGLGGYLAGRSYAVPDVSGGVSAMFKKMCTIRPTTRCNSSAARRCPSTRSR